ncbi:hypothetical protein M1I50_09680 [Clostridioides difficile]|nr:hypothetical protein [Clostridioides difficile]MCL0943253.1 hypothetical protein [Clostridioides difficile]MDI2845746.1 hypothetical protein [Clostridioides difficile]
MKKSLKILGTVVLATMTIIVSNIDEVINVSNVTEQKTHNVYLEGNDKYILFKNGKSLLLGDETIYYNNQNDIEGIKIF